MLSSERVRAPEIAGRGGRPIRVLHFISDSYPTEYFRLIDRHTDHRRFELQVASLRQAGGLQDGLREAGVPTFALGAERRSQYPLAVLKLAWWLRRNRIDVLHAHLFEASVVGLFAAKIARTPLAVFTGHHSHEVPLHARRSLFEVDRFAARRLAHVIVSPSSEMRDTFVDVYGCCPEDVVVIEHGLDLARFDPQRVTGEGVRRELGLERKVVFGAISKHFWVKNLESLVRAFAPVAADTSDAHLVILGLGDSTSLARLVEDLDLADRISIVRPRRDVPEVLAALDVFVHPALAESFGFVIVEAMAMARPVVATPVGIARDVIEDGVSGIRVTGTDTESLREALMRALACRAQWPELGAEARRRALAFTPERWVRAHEQLYGRLLADDFQELEPPGLPDT
jgi:glycosyltransferase involved in cell wall biosynthesis